MAQLSGECISKATRPHDVAQSNCAYSVAYKSIKERVFTMQVKSKVGSKIEHAVQIACTLKSIDKHHTVNGAKVY